MKPLVSIITPCYNGAEYLNQYFESIINQTYSNLELIFVDDGSTDNSGELACEYKKALQKKGIKFVYLYQQNHGQASAINLGLKKISGEYLIWPDSDDILDSESIEKRVDFLEKHQEYAFVRSNGDFFDYQTKEKMYRVSEKENRFNEDIFLDLILEKTYCCCGCYMVKVSAFKEIYPDLTIYESREGQNWQILVPIAGKYLCGYIDEDLYHVAIRRGSHSRKERTLDEQIERYKELKKILLDAILRSGRTDRDYEYIVDVKYDKLFYRTYLNYGDDRKGKEYYLKLQLNDELDEYDHRLYLKRFHPVWYHFYRLGYKVKRIFS